MALSDDSNQSGTCGRIPPDNDLRLGGDGPPIPASGFTGSFRVNPRSPSPAYSNSLLASVVRAILPPSPLEGV